MFKQQLSQPSKFWPPLTVHQEYWERNNCALVYQYDPADDGPEVKIILAQKWIVDPHV